MAKSALVNLSVNYDNETAPAGTKAKVKIGDQTLSADSPDFAKTLARGHQGPWLSGLGGIPPRSTRS